MKGRASRAIRTPGVALAVFLLLAAIPAGGVPPPQRATAVAATQEAVGLIEASRLDEALDALDRAIEADGEYWEAYYQRGRVFGLMSRWQEALDALVRATELNPGHGHSHRLSSLAAINLEEWGTAWDQAINAQLAGQDMTETLLNMYQLSPPPDDFAVRIAAVPVFVADVDTTAATADIDLPTNFNPESAMGARQGRASDLEDSAISQSALDLIRLQRAMRYALSESPGLAVVLDPGRARFILSMQITEITTTQPHAAKGYFRLIDIQEQEIIYRQPVDISNLESTPVIAPLLRRYVTDMSAWLARRDGGGDRPVIDLLETTLPMAQPRFPWQRYWSTQGRNP